MTWALLPRPRQRIWRQQRTRHRRRSRHRPPPARRHRLRWPVDPRAAMITAEQGVRGRAISPNGNLPTARTTPARTTRVLVRQVRGSRVPAGALDADSDDDKSGSNSGSDNSSGDDSDSGEVGLELGLRQEFRRRLRPGEDGLELGLRQQFRRRLRPGEDGLELGLRQQFRRRLRLREVRLVHIGLGQGFPTTTPVPGRATAELVQVSGRTTSGTLPRFCFVAQTAPCWSLRTHLADSRS